VVTHVMIIMIMIDDDDDDDNGLLMTWWLGMVQTRSQFEFCLMAVAEETHAILKALPQ